MNAYEDDPMREASYRTSVTEHNGMIKVCDVLYCLPTLPSFDCLCVCVLVFGKVQQRFGLFWWH